MPHSILPPSKGEETLIEGCGKGSKIPVSLVEGFLVVLKVASEQVVQTCPNDNKKGQHLGSCEHILDFRCPFHIGAVHPC